MRDLREAAHWVDSSTQARDWAGPRITYPIDEHALPQQVEWSEAWSLRLSDDQALMGFGQIVPKPTSRLHLARLIVKPSCRGRGYGRELARALLAQALAQGPATVSLNVFPGNRPALELYRQLGFIAVERAAGDATPDAQYMVYRS